MEDSDDSDKFESPILQDPVLWSTAVASPPELVPVGEDRRSNSSNSPANNNIHLMLDAYDLLNSNYFEAEIKDRQKKKSARRKRKKPGKKSRRSMEEEMCSAEPCRLPTIETIGREVDWVRCDGCERWLHMHCIDIDKNTITAEEDFFCKSCLSEHAMVAACAANDAWVEPQVSDLENLFEVESGINMPEEPLLVETDEEETQEDGLMRLTDGEDLESQLAEDIMPLSIATKKDTVIKFLDERRTIMAEEPVFNEDTPLSNLKRDAVKILDESGKKTAEQPPFIQGDEDFRTRKEDVDGENSAIEKHASLHGLELSASLQPDDRLNDHQPDNISVGTFNPLSTTPPSTIPPSTTLQQDDQSKYTLQSDGLFNAVDVPAVGTRFDRRSSLKVYGVHTSLQHRIVVNEAIVKSIIKGEKDSDFGGRYIVKFEGQDHLLQAFHNNFIQNKPVRVIRSSSTQGQYSPLINFRYDGVYKVTEVYPPRPTNEPQCKKRRKIKCTEKIEARISMQYISGQIPPWEEAPPNA